MDYSVGGVNYTSVLNTASHLLNGKTYLKNEEIKKERNLTNKQTFLQTFKNVFQTDSIGIEDKYNLEGLTAEEKKKVIENILADLQDAVYSAGSNLADNVNTETIKKYKDSVKNFVQFALENSLDVGQIVSGSLNPMKQKCYVIVKVIDEKINRLTQELLFNQLEKIKILERLDEIKGLLVDLVT